MVAETTKGPAPRDLPEQASHDVSEQASHDVSEQASRERSEQAPGRDGHPAPVRSGLLLFAVLGGMFLAMLDQTIVGTALPRITSDLHGSDLYVWVVTAYLLSATTTVPMYGRLSDIYGRKPLLLFGVSVFLAGSALCGAAQDMPQLIAFRGLQGLGAGALVPMSLTLVAELFPLSKSARVQGGLGGVMALSYLAGPFLGGIFTDYASWRWAFYVNVPIGLVLLAIVMARLPHRAGQGRTTRPDYLGIAVFTVMISSLLVGLTEKGIDDHTWLCWPVLGPLLATVPLLVWFILVERSADEPIVPLHLFRNATYTIVTIASFFTAFALYCGVVFLPRYFQHSHGLSATTSGIRIYPMMLGMVVGSGVTGLLMSRTRRYKPWLVASPFLIVAGTLLCGGLERDTSPWALGVWMTLIGVGLGPMLSGLIVAIQYAVPPRYIGTASANISFFRQIGGSVALAVAGTMYTAVIKDRALADGLPAAHAAASANVIPWLGVTGAVVALVALVVLPDVRLRLRAER